MIHKAMARLLAERRIEIYDPDDLDTPEPQVIHAPSEAFNIRVRSAVAMLRMGISRKDVRHRHGMIVLREALTVIFRVEEARKNGRRISTP